MGFGFGLSGARVLLDTPPCRLFPVVNAFDTNRQGRERRRRSFATEVSCSESCFGDTFVQSADSSPACCRLLCRLYLCSPDAFDEVGNAEDADARYRGSRALVLRLLGVKVHFDTEDWRF